MHWFWSTSGAWYAFWSGFGSCLGEFAIVGVVWKKLNCHTKGCYRVGLHRVEGSPFVVCRRHHPDVPDDGATHHHILTWRR